MTDIVDNNEAMTARAFAQAMNKRPPPLSQAKIEAIVTEGRDCSDCGFPIPAGRLRANPRAFRCITCQQQAERKG